MKILILLTLFSVTLAGFSPSSSEKNPLEGFDPVWKDAKYAYCNTARNVPYLTAAEKEVIFVLNLARQFPQQFNKTIVSNWPGHTGDELMKSSRYYISLQTLLQKKEPAGLLTADSLCWISAQCHAISSGQKGYYGHDRQSESCRKKEHFRAECCDYGNNDALEIIMSLLIDQDVPSLGHRMICLSNSYKAVGVSIKPHKMYQYNAVLDFTYP